MPQTIPPAAIDRIARSAAARPRARFFADILAEERLSADLRRLYFLLSLLGSLIVVLVSMWV